MFKLKVYANPICVRPCTRERPWSQIVFISPFAMPAYDYLSRQVKLYSFLLLCINWHSWPQSLALSCLSLQQSWSLWSKYANVSCPANQQCLELQQSPNATRVHDLQCVSFHAHINKHLWDLLTTSCSTSTGTLLSSSTKSSSPILALLHRKNHFHPFPTWPSLSFQSMTFFPSSTSWTSPPWCTSTVTLPYSPPTTSSQRTPVRAQSRFTSQNLSPTCRIPPHTEPSQALLLAHTRVDQRCPSSPEWLQGLSMCQ